MAASLTLSFAFVAALAGPPTTNSGPIHVDSVLVTLIDEVQVPARAEGALLYFSVREGDTVTKGQELGRIDDLEARAAAKQLELESDIARREAENDLKVRFAHKNAEVAKTELKRAEESVKQFSRAVSATEIDRLRLTSERTELEILQADHEAAVARLNHDVKQNAFQFASETVARRGIEAPLDGVVVEVYRRQGEWVKPGDTVLRIVRVDRLKVEGFLDHRQLTEDLKDHAATLTVDLPGKQKAAYTGRVVFVSPEVNPVDGQVRFWAEIENADGQLRPGLKGRLEIR